MSLRSKATSSAISFSHNHKKDAKTLTATTLGIMTLSISDLPVTLSTSSVIMLNAIVHSFNFYILWLSAILLTVSRLNAVMMSVIMLNVAAPLRKMVGTLLLELFDPNGSF